MDIETTSLACPSESRTETYVRSGSVCRVPISHFDAASYRHMLVVLLHRQAPYDSKVSRTLPIGSQSRAGVDQCRKSWRVIDELHCT